MRRDVRLLSDAELAARERTPVGGSDGSTGVIMDALWTTAGEVRISNQLLSDRFAVDLPLAPRMRRARFWLRVRTIRLRERVATWIAPWLRDHE